MTLASLNFRNRNRGRQPRANWFIRKGRELRRKRVAYARLAAAHALKLAQREIDRVYQLARVYDVPIDAVGPMPVLPALPGADWVEVRRGMGELRAPVVPAQAVNI